jgi:DNA-binding transcriptional ArsR family regulator
MTKPSEPNPVNVERVFRALADETRLAMVRLLADSRDLCVCEVMAALGISETRASRNLGLLCDAGLLRGERQGKWMHYSLDRSRNLIPLLSFIRRQVPAIALCPDSRKKRKC